MTEFILSEFLTGLGETVKGLLTVVHLLLLSLSVSFGGTILFNLYQKIKKLDFTLQEVHFPKHESLLLEIKDMVKELLIRK